MSNTQKSAFVATGLMLFALFFGAGNLIFPALMGQQSGSAVFSALSGFLITGVGLPLLGVIAIGYSGSARCARAGFARCAVVWRGVFGVAVFVDWSAFCHPAHATVSFEIGVVPFLGDVSESAKQNQLGGFCGGVFWFVVLAFDFPRQNWWIGLAKS